MFDGKWDAKEAPDCWVIKNRKNGSVVFSYRTYQGNEKKSFIFRSKVCRRGVKQVYSKSRKLLYINNIILEVR